ncbi:MAG: tetratricopeptide repeat protein [Gammaproteobacteria bacterium]|nr:MAG: tetratricopeptide repeat protein [Gammaproteobacteria bacterium]
MLLKWFNAREATEVGSTLADDFLQSVSRSSGTRRQGTQSGPQGQDLQKLLRRVDREAGPLKLNLIKRAALANSFKWRLLEKGVEQQLVDELTHALVLRLTANQANSVPSEQAAEGLKRRSGSRPVQALHTRGNELLARGGYAEALECYQQLVNLDSRDAVARNGLGTALAQLTRFNEAEDQFRRAIGIRSGFVEAHFNLAGVLQSRGRLDESELPLRRALKLKPSYIDARVSLGTSLRLLGRLQEARDCYEQALRAAPRNVQALVGTGQIEGLEGRFAEAEAAYRRALEVDPGAAYAWSGLVWLRKMTPADGAWLKRAEEIAASGLTPIDEAAMRFAIGKYYDDVGDFARAFRSYQRANELQKLAAEPYDRGARTRFVDDLIRAYTSETIGGTRAGASDSMRPAFVVGMPRSGTTLVAQIIHSHPVARSAGELAFWPDAVHKHAATLQQGPPDEALTRKLATGCLSVLVGRFPDPLRVVDKTPFNSDHLGVIHSVFPRARIIYLRRDPIDACLSCYFQAFLPSLNFTMDLSDLAHYYQEHRRLIDHWRRVLPPEILLEVPYAGLIGAQEEWTRRIVDFLELPWDPCCLEFHRTERVVRTASYWQVRQPIYKDSVGRWRNYEKFIGPLLDLRDRTPA